MLKRIRKAGVILCLLSLISCQTKLPVDYVDPFICTQDDHGQWMLAAHVPLPGYCPIGTRHLRAGRRLGIGVGNKQ